MGWCLHSPSLRAADVELLAREAGAVDCGLENLLVCLFLGITARGRAARPRCITQIQQERKRAAGRAPPHLPVPVTSQVRVRPRAGSGNAASVTASHTRGGGGGRGEQDGAAPALREEQTGRGSRKTIGPPTGTGRASLSQTQVCTVPTAQVGSVYVGRSRDQSRRQVCPTRVFFGARDAMVCVWMGSDAMEWYGMAGWDGGGRRRQMSSLELHQSNSRGIARIARMGGGKDG